MEMKIWIIAPCFYDVQSFQQLKKQAESVISSQFPGADVIFALIDDSGGQDAAIASIPRVDKLVIVSPPFNLGHQGALVFALRALSSKFRDHDYIVTMDSDGEDRPEDIPLLMKSLAEEEENVSLVSIAQRTKRKTSVAFKVLYFFFRIFFFTLTGNVVHNGNFMAYRGWFARNVLFHPFFDYCYSSSVLTLARNICYVPLARGSRFFGESKMTTISLIAHGFRMLLPFSDRIAVRAVVAATVLFALTSVATVCAAYLLIQSKPHALLFVVIAGSALIVLAVVMAAAALLFNIFNQTMAIALRQLTFRERPPHSAFLHGPTIETSE
jgi:glycosyltransferase involved in cell wall biosynthesis